MIKDPIALLSAGWLHEKYNTKVICLIRNPLSFVGSLKAANWNYYFHDLRDQDRLLNTWLSPFKSEIERYAEKPGDIIDHGCLLWNIFHYVITDYQKLYPTWTFIKYEDIVENPIIEFEKLFDAVGLRIDSIIRRYIQNYTSKKNPGTKDSPAYGPRQKPA